MTWTSKGVRYQKARTFPSRYSPGRVHLTFWNKDAKLWQLWCRTNAWYHMERVMDDTEITCKHCQKASVK